MEFILTGTHGEVISVKDYGQDEYLLTWPCRKTGATGTITPHTVVISKEQFKRLAKAS